MIGGLVTKSADDFRWSVERAMVLACRTVARSSTPSTKRGMHGWVVTSTIGEI